MKKIMLAAVTLIVTGQLTTAQNIGIGTALPNASALLDVTATNKGVLVPRLTNTQMNAIASPANGLLVYNTDSAAFAYRTGAAWVFVKGNATASNDWSTKGNSGTNPAINFIGTTDRRPLVFKQNNVRAGLLDSANTSWGQGALNPNSTGTDNTAIGSSTLANNTTGTNNTAMGRIALASNTTGRFNTANGYQALISNTEGSNNTALGYGAGINNQVGNGNVFIGYGAGFGENSSNKLYINNTFSGSTNSLIYGEFDNKILSIGGRLGVGTTAPETLLHLKNDNTDANASQLIIESNSGFGNSTTAAIEFRSNFSSGGSGPSGRIKSYYTSNNYTDAKTTFQTVGPGPAFVDAMTLTNGRVGIGTTTPHGDLQLPNTLGNRKIVLLEDADNDHQYNGFGINAFIMRYQAAALTSSHVFYSGSSASTSTELMRITGNGEVGIGKIPLTTSNDSRLQIKQMGFQNCLGLETGNSTNHWDFYISSEAASNLVLYYNGSNKGSFDNVSGSYIANSDRRMKKDITPQAPVLRNLAQLQAYQYHYLDNQPTDRYSNGFMAQEVQKIFPDAVVENEMKDGEKRLGINYQYFTVLAIKGLQEQQQQIQLQEERIAKLEAMMKTLAGMK